SGVASPTCSAIVQQFFRGRSASSVSRNPRTRRRHSIRPNRPAIRSSSSSTPADQPAGPTLARATTAGPSDVHTADDGHAVAALSANQDQAIYGWSISPYALRRRWRGGMSGAAPAVGRRQGRQPDRLRPPQHFGYGAGDAANDLAFSLTSMFLAPYYTDAVGIAVTTVGRSSSSCGVPRVLR